MKVDPLSLVKRIEGIANSPSRDRGYTRDFYSYPAKFLAALPRELIKLFTSTGNLVYDPYCGGGTTGLESMLLERRSVGYDLNPFAILLSNVKTRRLDLGQVNELYRHVIAVSEDNKTLRVMDEDDEFLLGEEVAFELGSLAHNIESRVPEEEYRDFFKVAFLHTFKLVGRRDFRSSRDKSAPEIRLFDDVSELAVEQPLFSQSTDEQHVVLPLFMKKVRRMRRGLSTLPNTPMYQPVFVLGSNHDVDIEDSSVDLIITSPPYKDLDVEYMQIQIQRPEEHRSKRSDVIARLLGIPLVDKQMLCGCRNASYWDNLVPSLRETSRTLKEGHLAFFWIGFKTAEDKEIFESTLEAEGFHNLAGIPVRLSNDRAASSRSTHHGRNTNMMQLDFLFMARKESS